jgi:hypothetical protein
MECPFTECVYNDGCGFLEITKQIPKSKDKCSWYSTNLKETIKLRSQTNDNESSKTSKRRSTSKKKQSN